MKKQFALSLLSAAVLGLAMQTGQASVVISNLDPGNVASGFTTYQLGQATLLSNRPISLTSVQFSQATGNTTASETFAVYARNTDGTLGSSLFNGFALSYDATLGVTTAKVSTSFTLQANSGYFFVLTATTGTVDWDYTFSTDYAAAFGASLPATNDAFTRGNATSALIYYSLTGGVQLFQVNGSALPAVPEPSTWALAGGALAGGAVLLARRRFAAA